jgi:hypothetical protein
LPQFLASPVIFTNWGKQGVTVRELLGIDFLREPNCNYNALRLPVCLLLKPWKGSGATEGLLSREGAHFLGWDRHVGNERL